MSYRVLIQLLPIKHGNTCPNFSFTNSLPLLLLVRMRRPVSGVRTQTAAASPRHVDLVWGVLSFDQHLSQRS